MAIENFVEMTGKGPGVVLARELRSFDDLVIPTSAGFFTETCYVCHRASRDDNRPGKPAKTMKKLTPTGSVQINVPIGRCRIFATDGDDIYEIELPLDQFLQFAGKAQQETTSYNSTRAMGQRVDGSRTPAILPGVVEVGTAHTLTPQGVVIVCDRGSAGELVLAFTTKNARAIGEALILQASKIDERG